MTSSSTDLQLAVQLFERGFQEDRIEEALQHCSTLEEAVAWLSCCPGSSSGSATGHIHHSTHGGPPGTIAKLPKASGLTAEPSGRRRTRRKIADQATVALDAVQDSAPSAAVGSSAGSTVDAGVSTPPGALPSASGCQEEALPPLLSADVDVGALPIEPRDASEWWREAAARWRSVLGDLKKKVAVQPDTSAASPAPPKRQRWEESPKAASDLAAVAATLPRRPPATPCSAEPSQKQQQQHHPQVGSSTEAGLPTHIRSPARCAGKVLTPCSSPRAMQINSRVEACEICCNDVQPWRAVRLGCGHGWYCAQCILKHSEARLEVGAASVTCPECCTALAERDLRKLLPSELMDRLLARSLEQAISSAADLWACPTPNCPMRVALGDGEIPRLRCTLCKKDSCLRCFAQPYHKGLTCEEHAARMREKGKRQQKDEDSFLQWIKETGTRQCPTCRMGVTKENLRNQHTQRSECHKMLCRNCNTRFCFKCLKVLTDTFTCKCTIDAHGFINPHTGRRLNHLRRSRGAAKERAGR
mmetsp:Transcript_14631/g.41919  ORF Transcript_14631/g.41919 Transcript_14631/m.41919 type:complete len:530 (-) Transcript_14631:246-1835(-)